MEILEQQMVSERRKSETLKTILCESEARLVAEQQAIT